MKRELRPIATGIRVDDDRSAAHIRAELRRIRLARRTGAARTARVHLDRLIDYVWFSDDGGAA